VDRKLRDGDGQARGAADSACLAAPLSRPRDERTTQGPTRDRVGNGSRDAL
jgi:hypothetical protein